MHSQAQQGLSIWIDVNFSHKVIKSQLIRWGSEDRQVTTGLRCTVCRHHSLCLKAMCVGLQCDGWLLQHDTMKLAARSQ